MGMPKNFKPRHRPFVDREQQARENDPSGTAIDVVAAPQTAVERLTARAERFRETVMAKSGSRVPYYIIRRDRDFTDAKKEIFVFTMGELGTTSAAAEAAGITCATAYAHRNPNNNMYDQDFAEAWQEATEVYNAGVELEIHERAIVGWQEPVFGGKDKDTIVGHVTKKSDKMLTMLAKRRMPQEYGDKVEIKQSGGTTGVNTEIMPGVDLTKLSTDQRKKLKEFLTSMDGKDRSDVIDVEYVEPKYSDEHPYNLIEETNEE